MKRLVWLVAFICLFMACPASGGDGEGEEIGIKHRVDTLEYYVDLVMQWIVSFENQKGPDFQLHDSQGKQVGELLGMSSPWNWQLAMVAVEAGGHNAMVRVSKPGIWWDELLFFTDPNCQGTAYLPAGRIGMSWFDPPVVISVLPGIPESRSPHAPIDLPPVPAEEIVKAGHPHGCGDPPGPPSGEFLPVAPIMRGDAPIDLHLDYPPPYQISD